ncbi:MAG: large conductance mechanosensitive channel protein MscL, partial [Candidatus Hodarchaeales archaeon]
LGREKMTKDADLLEEVRKIRELLEPAPTPPPAPPKNFYEEFKGFLMKYKVMGLAVAFILGLYLGALVQALVSDLIMPLINLIMPDVAWEEIALFPTAQSPNGIFLIGHFTGELVTFIIVAFVIFLLVKATSRLGIE